MRFRIVCLLAVLALFVTPRAAAQRSINMPEHDGKLYYFGLTFGLNFSQHRMRYDPSFAATDTFKIIQPYWSPGFNLGLMANLRLNRVVDLRFIPSLAFAEKRLRYSTPRAETVEDRGIESIYLHLPLQAKIKSDRINNFRFYALAGGKFDYDLAANARSRRRDEFLKVTPADLGYEIGMGFEFYYPNFIFAPEIKLSQGLKNQLFRGDRTLPLVNAIEEINTRTIVISIHLQG